ncbi:DUF397 domain-containing protein [Actinomadura kijaniata]|uniref:DUF397 domain-containing protein n=1 Tax=Actinomadura kijaniata TaxID=46161 RepID=UPI0009FF8DFE|nr:DUF397 domain-containing protein [Actinomadura kijaniata]
MEDLKIMWRKSSRSGGDGGHCVELGNLGDAVGVRDSKDPTAGHLCVGRTDLRALMATLKAIDQGV